ncbi:MAG: hypothetical protein ACTSQW_02600 [Promethearchaeota archaeon]
MAEPMKESKIMNMLDKYFHKIFSPSHIAYTIFFFIEILVLIVFYFLGSIVLGDIGLFLATVFALSFIFLMFIGVSSRFESFLFSKSLDKHKAIIFVSTLGLSFVIVLLYFLFGHSTQIPIQFIGWDYILPGFYIVVYFGWNIAQIFFLKTEFEDIAFKADEKVISDSNVNRNKYLSMIFLILAISIPILTQVGTYFAFIPFFEPQNPTDSLEPLLWFNGWNIAMYGIIVLISYRLVFLYIKSVKNDTHNIFSSIFFILVWLIIWYRSFSFINSFRSVSGALGIDAFRALIDILLMIFTAILVIRGLGGRTFKFRIFNPNNLAFFLFAFTLIYIEGQIVMITGAGSISGTYTNRSQVNLVNNAGVLLITILFYWFYSEYTLKKNGLILQQMFDQEEVIQIVTDFKSHLINRGALDSANFNESDFQQFLRTKKLSDEEQRQTEDTPPYDPTNTPTDT